MISNNKYPETSIRLMFDIELEKLEGEVDRKRLEKELREKTISSEIQINSPLEAPLITDKKLSFKWEVYSRNDCEVCKKDLENLEGKYFLIPYISDNPKENTFIILTKIIKVTVRST